MRGCEADRLRTTTPARLQHRPRPFLGVCLILKVTSLLKYEQQQRHIEEP
jgi:hypothetical protein